MAYLVTTRLNGPAACGLRRDGGKTTTNSKTEVAEAVARVEVETTSRARVVLNVDPRTAAQHPTRAAYLEGHAWGEKYRKAVMTTAKGEEYCFCLNIMAHPRLIITAVRAGF